MRMEEKSADNSAEKSLELPVVVKPRGVFWPCLFTNIVLWSALGGYVYTQREVLLAAMQPAAAKQQEVSAEIATLKSRLSVLEQRLAVQEARKIPVENSVQNTGEAAKVDLSAIEADIKALKEASAGDVGAEVENLKQQISQLNQLQQGMSLQLQQQAMQTPPDMRIPAVFQSLRSKALDGAVFEDSYQRFLALVQPHPLLVEATEKLEDYAGTGRPTLAEIQRSFQETLRDYLRDKDGVNNSLTGKIERNLASFITIRKLEDKGDSTMAMVNRAEQAVKAGNISKAREELAELPSDVAPFFAAWLEEAKAYIRIPEILSGIDQRIADMMMQRMQPAAPATKADEAHDS